MRFLRSLALGLLGLATSVAAQDDTSSVAVELDRGSFKKFIEQNTVVLTDCEFTPPRERNANLWARAFWLIFFSSLRSTSHSSCRFD